MGVRRDGEEVVGEIRVRGGQEERSVKLPAGVDPRQLQLLLEGLQNIIASPGRTFGEMAEDWWASTSRVWPGKERHRLVLLASLWKLTESELTIRTVNAFLAELHKAGRAADYCNKIRNTGKLVVNAAIEAGEWKGPNPFERAKRLRGKKVKRARLTLQEARAVLPQLQEWVFWLAYTMLSIGLRPGELFALQKVDVDLERRELIVRRSHQRNETKTGAERVIYLPDELLPILKGAMERSPSPTRVFGAKGGGQHTAGLKLSRALQHAFRRAGLCTGYDYSCRRKGCGFREFCEFREDRRCPQCGFKLWAHGRTKPIRFYDLRGSCATLHQEAGCDPWVIERMLGHSQNITGRDYLRCSPEYQRAEVNKLRLLVELPGGPEKSDGGAVRFLTSGQDEPLVPDTGQDSALDVGNTPMAAASNDSARGGTRTHDPRLRRPGVAGEKPDPLTTEQAAEELGISAYTLREMVRTGRLLGTFRVGERIRVPRSALEEFISSGGEPVTPRKSSGSIGDEP